MFYTQSHNVECVCVYVQYVFTIIDDDDNEWMMSSDDNDEWMMSGDDNDDDDDHITYMVITLYRYTNIQWLWSPSILRTDQTKKTLGDV